MMPHRLKRRFNDAVVPSDARLVIVTHANPTHMASAISLVLAAEDQNCHLACPQAIAEKLTKTKMIPPSQLIVMSSEVPIDLRFIRMTMVHGTERVVSKQVLESSKSDERGNKTDESGERPVQRVKSQTSIQTLSSFTGGAAAGWIF